MGQNSAVRPNDRGYRWGCLRFVSAGECYGNLYRCSGGEWLGQEPRERRARRHAARCPGIPFAKPEEVAASRGQDVAKLDFRLPAIARAAQAAAADAAGERARDPGAERLRLAEVVRG